ncbi:MAG: hypothetical protein KC766_24980 [Myxococcales bacterium]|nr:hypothetical protein [Myxococcales bacterium]
MRSTLTIARHPFTALMGVACALWLTAGCEIVQSNIPITLEDDSAEDEDAGGEGLPAYPGAECGQASAVLCTVASPGTDAGIRDAAPDTDAPDSGMDAEPDAAPADAAETGSEDAALDAGTPEPAPVDAGAREWCALRCFKRCDDQQWECTGTVCGRGEPPPTCEPTR